jgi:hypothetical protein
MGGACSTHGGEVNAWFWWGIMREGDHVEYPGVDGSIVLNWIF